MKTLATPCKIVLECYQRQGNSRTASHRREHVRFRPSKKLVTAGFLRMVTAKYKCINPIASSSSSTPSLPSEPQVNLETSETEEQGTCQTKKRVHVKFQIQKECSFGEQFMIVGNDPMLGLWSPAGAIPLQWSDGHVWTVELDVPAEETIQYKFILKGINGTISWQPGHDRILKTWDTEKMIFVWEDWVNADVQKIMEEEPSAHDDAWSEITSEMLIVADILTHRDKDVDSKVGNGSIAAHASPELEKKPVSVTAHASPELEKKPVSAAQGKQMVADNILHPQEKPVAFAVDNINYLKENRIVNTNDVKSGEMKTDQLAAESSQETNGRVPLVAKSLSIDVKESLITGEGEAVLVPGLSPVSESSNIEKSIALDGSLGVNEVMGHHLPKPDEEHESKNNQHQAKMIEVRNKNQQFESVIKQEPAEQVVHEVLDNDIQWGRRTLQSFLSNFGLMWPE